MFLLRVVVESAVALLFRLVTAGSLLQGLSLVLALGVSLAVGGREAPAWLKDSLVRCGLVSAILAAGGLVLVVIQARAARGLAEAPPEDDTLPGAWVLPALGPTLLLPAMAAMLSRDLVGLWIEAVRLLDRMGIREEFARGGNFAGLAFMPVFAALAVPALEAAAGLLLIAAPPLMLLLLTARSRRFRVSCQLLVVAQAGFVFASIAGADVFGRIVGQILPHLRGEGGPEMAQVIAGLTRARDVLATTVTGYAAVLAGYGLSLWVLMAVHAPRRGEYEAPVVAGAVPLEAAATDSVTPKVAAMPSSPTARSYDRVTDLPQAARQSLEGALARYRAGRGAEPEAPPRSGTDPE